MIKRILILVFAFLTANITAQEVISAAGAHMANGAVQISWTLGEPVIETFTGTNNILTQGMHQTRLIVTAISDLKFPGIEINVYPNPASERLNIKVSNTENIKLNFNLIDISGRKLLQKEFLSDLETLSMKSYDSGIYLLKVVTTNNQPVKTFKIVKN